MKIIEVTGTPSKEDIEAIKSPFASTMLESLPPTTTRSLEDMYPHASEDALDLMRKLLMFNPDLRISADDAAKHPYVLQFRDPDDEPICEEVISIPIDDNIKYSIDDYRNKLYQDIKKKKKEMKSTRRRKTRKDKTGSSSSSSSKKSTSSSKKK